MRVRREIELAPGGPRVTIRNTLTRVAENPHPVHIWCVSQVRPAEFHLLHVSAEGPPKDPVWHDFGAKKPLGPHVRAVGAALRYDRPPGSSKIGTFGTWVAAVYEDLAFVEHVPYDPAGPYPDKSSVQLFASDDYAELETLSPNVPLAEGESLSNTVTWVLVERPKRAPLEEFVELIMASVNSP